MDPLAFLLAHNATRNLVSSADPADRPRRRRPDDRSERVRFRRAR